MADEEHPLKEETTRYPVNHPARTAEQAALKPRPYPTCDAINRSGGPCGRPAGTGTDHKGVGRCFMHGGTLQSKNSPVFKHGLYSQIYPTLLEKMEELRGSKDIFDLREHILMLEATIHLVLQNAQETQDLFPAVKVIDTASKVVQRLNEIENGRRLVISVESVDSIIMHMGDIIERHVPDPYIRSLIAADLVKVYSRKIPELPGEVNGSVAPDYATIEAEVADDGD